MLEKNKKRALRRYHLRRMKAKAIRVYYFNSPDRAIRYANHLKMCSCYMCGNARKHWGAPIRDLRKLQDDE